ncbi:MAG: hypothetical protein UY63_C0020G0002 [Parcubacteria group bacterium GW2011_GWA2_51_10]|nr:MAG: hypothetical protein UY63_C0020G0002 [Parcubacteria group bacterium GW2011_GWA2_51_10]
MVVDIGLNTLSQRRSELGFHKEDRQMVTLYHQAVPGRVHIATADCKMVAIGDNEEKARTAFRARYPGVLECADIKETAPPGGDRTSLDV